jgi:hypothetical protein
VQNPFNGIERYSVIEIEVKVTAVSGIHSMELKVQWD